MSEISENRFHDIGYRGILTFRGLRLLALLAMTLSQLAGLAVTANQLLTAFGEPFLPDWANKICVFLRETGAISFPLLMISTFTNVLNRRENFIRSLITYFVLALLTYLAIVFVLYRVISNILLYSPIILTELDSDETMHNFVVRLIAKLVEGIIPGDGTLHLENLNPTLSMAGLKFTMPNSDELISILTKAGVPDGFPQMLIQMIGSLQPMTVAQALTDVLSKFLKLIPEQYMDYFSNSILPILTTRIAYNMNINVFWDLFLYTLAFFFISYTPKNISGANTMLFRCCAIVPIGWMIISFLVTGTAKITNLVSLPVWVSALMSKQKLSSMAIFLALLLFEKYMKQRYIDLVGTDEGWDVYRDSNKNSLVASVYLCVVLIIVSLLDFGLSKIPGLEYWGIGDSSTIWMACPCLLLFSYNKMPKYKIFNAAVPLYYVAHYMLLMYLFFTAVEMIDKML